MQISLLRRSTRIGIDLQAAGCKSQHLAIYHAGGSGGSAGACVLYKRRTPTPLFSTSYCISPEDPAYLSVEAARLPFHTVRCLALKSLPMLTCATCCRVRTLRTFLILFSVRWSPSDNLTVRFLHHKIAAQKFKPFEVRLRLLYDFVSRAW